MILTGRGKTILDTKIFDEDSSVPRLLIYKLHGSSDWWKNSETDEIEQVQARLRTSEEYKRSLIYPTREKFNQIREAPFSFFYKRFKDNLTSQGIRACIAIGYSFRDRPINDVFAEALRKGLKLIIIDKSLNKQQLMAEFKSYALDSSITDDGIKIHNINFGNWVDQPDNMKRFSEIINNELNNL